MSNQDSSKRSQNTQKTIKVICRIGTKSSDVNMFWKELTKSTYQPSLSSVGNSSPKHRVLPSKFTEEGSQITTVKLIVRFRRHATSSVPVGLTCLWLKWLSPRFKRHDVNRIRKWFLVLSSFDRSRGVKFN